jgi:thioredoxin reductase (NADPH)
MDYDAIIVGGGLAGLTAGMELARAKHRVLLLDKESFGGQAGNLEWIEDYPVTGEKVSGPALASQMVEEAGNNGLQMELGEVVEIESYSGCKSVTCDDGKAYTASLVILASGRHPRKLGVPGEDRFQNKGMIHCAFCDAGLYADRVVAVCGGGDAGLMEALYLAKFASRVHVIEAQDRLSASPKWQERARAHPKLELRCGQKAVAIRGEEFVTGVQVEEVASGGRHTLDAHGVLAHVGFEAATGYLGELPLDEQGYVPVNSELETEVPEVLAAGDVRSGSPRTAVSAVSDGKAAAAQAQRLLRRLGG